MKNKSQIRTTNMIQNVQGEGAAKTSFSKTVTGERKSSEYGTPMSFFKTLDSIFNFELDPCAMSGNTQEGQLSQDLNRLGVKRFYTKESDGLFQFWDANTFVNPPFGTKKGEQISNWIHKFKESAKTYPSFTYVMLLPLRMESNWFQDQVWTDPFKILYVIRGRLKFYSSTHNKNDDPHPIGSMLYIRPAEYMTVDKLQDLKKNIPGFFIPFTTRGEQTI